MKYMFVSDIHGDIEVFNLILKIYSREEANKLVILGDTSSWTNKANNLEIANKLNEMKKQIEVIRGNCDSDHFEELLNFEIFDMDNLYINGKFVTITHGHYYNANDLPSNCGDIFIQGHTHIPMLTQRGDKILANPGSITKPRGVPLRCYIIMDEEKIQLITIEGKLVSEIYLDKK